MNSDKIYAMVSTSAKKIPEVAVPSEQKGLSFGWYKGETKYDFNTEISEGFTLNAKWVDDVSPEVSGVYTSKKYCTNKEITVWDYSTCTVTVNDHDVALNDDKFTLDMSVKEDKIIVVTDSLNNSSTLTVKYGHTYGEWVNEEPKTCTANGTKAHKDCGVCGKRFDSNGTEITDLTITAGHTFGEWVEEAPATCTTDGFTAHKTCAACNKHFDSNDNEITNLTIQAVGHKLGSFIEEVPASKDAEGVKGHKDCGVCGKHFDINRNELIDLGIEKLPTLSGGAIAGIAVGGVAVVGVGGFVIVWFVIKKKKWADLAALFSMKK